MQGGTVEGGTEGEKDTVLTNKELSQIVFQRPYF